MPASGFARIFADMQAANLGFIATVMLIEATPGPNMAYLAALTLAEGRSAGLRAIAGIATGLLILGVAAALGVTQLLTQSTVAWNVVRWGGIAYLLWLAWDAWRTKATVAAKAPPSDKARYYLRGVTTNLLNPKAALFFTILLPEFVDRTRPPLLQTLMLTVTSIGIATLVHFCIVLLAARAQRGLMRTGRTQVIQRAMAFALLGIALWFAATTSR